ncbi:GNAT family N-acetyltransferase [bacterium]|nr:GNAT family N-acetyltransferase [bacterium]
MNDLLFRPFQIKDYSELIQLWQDSSLSYRPKGRDSLLSMSNEIEHEYSHLILAEKAGNLLGSILASHDGRRGWINRLAVHPSFRKKGLARLLIEKAEHWLLGQGLGILVCLIEEENTASQELFKSCNYVEHKEIIYYSKRLRSDI